MKHDHHRFNNWFNWFRVVSVSIVPLLGILMTPAFVQAQFNGQSPQRALAHQHTELASDHKNLSIDHTEVNQKLDQILTILKMMTDMTPTPMCGVGTEAQRFVPSADGQAICDNTSGLHWEQAPSTLTFSHESALAHCLDLGGGYRLPRIKELLTLIDYSVGNQATLFNAGPFTGILTARYWTTNPSAEFPTLSWAISFRNADVGVAPNGNALPAWCVR